MGLCVTILASFFVVSAEAKNKHRFTTLLKCTNLPFRGHRAVRVAGVFSCTQHEEKIVNAKIYNLAILVFENVEVLDFAGPFEAFSTTGALHPFNTFLVAETTEIISARNGLRIAANYSLDNCPPINILLVPGGPGTEKEIDNSYLIDWIRRQSSNVDLMLSDCDGAILLGKAGLLAGKKATTHHLDVERLRSSAPNAIILPDARVVDNGNLIISAGVSAGIDMSLYVISKLCGMRRAEETARLMEYNWSNRAVTF